MSRALTVRQPWAESIVGGEKPVEYRTWATRYRGTLLIHSSRSRDGWRSIDPKEWADAFPGMTHPAAMVYGAILGAVDLVDCVASQEAEGEWDWILARPRRLRHPIPCSGRVGLWVPPAPVLEMVAMALQGEIATA